MHLFANGCSWTYGGGLELDDPSREKERLSVTWPAKLSEKLNCTYTNIATGGGSNQRIVRTTIEWIYNNKNFIKDNKILAIIQWSEPSRFEYYQPLDKSDSYELDPDRWAFCGSSFVKQQGMNPKTAAIFKDHRLYTYTQQEGSYSILYNCLSLAKIFDIHNIKYYFWGPLYSINSCNSIIKDCILDIGPWLDQDIERPYNMWEYDRVGKTSWSDYDAHPNRKGHEQIAEIILKELKKYE